MLTPMMQYIGLNKDLPDFHVGTTIPEPLLNILVAHLFRQRPKMVVELGSGLSTLMMGKCLKIIGSGQLLSLEQCQKVHSKHQELVNQLGLASFVEVAHAPLEDLVLNGNTYPWYALDPLLSVNTVDLVLVDGPLGVSQDNARYPAVPVLIDKLSAWGVIFMDDAARANEQGVIAAWQEEFKELRVDYLPQGRGIAVLRRRRTVEAVDS